MKNNTGPKTEWWEKELREKLRRLRYIHSAGFTTEDIIISFIHKVVEKERKKMKKKVIGGFGWVKTVNCNNNVGAINVIKEIKKTIDEIKKL